MNGFEIPVTITSRFSDKNAAQTIKDSIDDFIDLIITSPNGSFKADYYFGFVFQNSRFENSDEDERIDAKKIHGYSYNRNNYAYDLKLAIEEYESRLNNIEVSMFYDPDYKKVTIEVSGKYNEDYMEKNYKKEITFYIW